MPLGQSDVCLAWEVAAPQPGCDGGEGRGEGLGHVMEVSGSGLLVGLLHHLLDPGAVQVGAHHRSVLPVGYHRGLQ